MDEKLRLAFGLGLLAAWFALAGWLQWRAEPWAHYVETHRCRATSVPDAGLHYSPEGLMFTCEVK
jgi:hypothetical protein